MATLNTKRNKRRQMADINVVPYIDVMLVLLVIFMITAPLLTQGVHVNLPQAKAKSLSSKEQGPLIVSVDKWGRYYLNTSPNPEASLTPEHLVNYIAAELSISQQQNKQRSVLVKGDRDVPYGKVVEAMVLLQNAGVDKVGLMTESPFETKRRQG